SVALLNVIPLSMRGTARLSRKISRLHEVGPASCSKASAGPAQNRTQSATQNLEPTPSDRAPPAPKGGIRFTHVLHAKLVNSGTTSQPSWQVRKADELLTSGGVFRKAGQARS